MYGLAFEYIGTAYRVYVNDRVVAEAGIVDISPDKAHEVYLPKTIYFQASGDTTIDVEFLNYSDAFTYIKSVALGSMESIQKYRFILNGRDIVSVTLLLLLSFISASFYIVRVRDKSSRYFAFLCLVFAIRAVVVNERLLIHLVPEISFELQARLGFIPICLGVYYLTKYLVARDINILPRWLNKTSTVLSLVVAIIVAVVPANISSVYLIPIILVLVALVFLVAFINLFKRYLLYKDNLLMLVSIGFVLFVTVHDTVANFIPLSFPYLSSNGLLIFFLLQGGILSQRFADLLNETEAVGQKNKELAEELAILNESLETLVNQRTEALMVKTKELEISNSKLKGLNKHLENLSFIDELTKIPNRRMFFNEIDKYFYSAQREKSSMVLMLMDIDYFKRYNDVYGHVKGDWCLFNIAQVIEQIANDHGYLAARYGGEEFILAGFGCSKADSIRLGETIREALDEMTIEHKASEVSTKVTMSIGAIHIEQVDNEAIMSLVDKADNMLYRAKSSGRDRFLI